MPAVSKYVCVEVNKFGFKECLECSKIIYNKNQRDIERKKFCSRKCLGYYTVKHKLDIKEHILKMQSKCHTPEVNAKKGHKGAKHPKWIADRNKVKNRPRYEMREWSQAVFKRDDYTCQFCGIRGGRLEADHIKPYSRYPELRWDLNNGRTLCKPCHKTTDTYGIKMRWNYGRQK